MKVEDLEGTVNSPFSGGDGAGSTISMSQTSSTGHLSAKSGYFQVNTIASTGWAYGGFSPACGSVTATGATTLTFYVQTDTAISIQAELHNTNANKWKSTPATSVPANPGVWQLVTISLAATPGIVLNSIDYFGLVFGAGISNANVFVDDIYLNGAAAPTATPTLTIPGATSTPTATATSAGSTATFTATRTPTATATSTPACGVFPMKFEDLEVTPNFPFAGGDGVGSTATMSWSTAVSRSATHSEYFVVNTVASTGWAYGGFGTNYPNCGTGVVATGATDVTFWVMTDVTVSLQAELHNTNANKWKSTPATTVTASPGVWQQVTVSLAATPALVLANVDYFGLVFGAGISNANVYLDDIYFSSGAATITPTLTLTPTSTNTATLTLAGTSTFTATATSTPTATATSTPGCGVFPLKYEDLETLPLNFPFSGGDGAGSTVAMNLDSVTVHGGANSESFVVNTIASTGYAYGGFGTNYPSCGTGVVATGATVLKFYVMTDKTILLQAELHNTNANKWKSNPAVTVNANPGVWQQVSISLAATPALVLANVDYFGLVFGAGISSATVYLDDIYFDVAAAPTATPTATACSPASFPAKFEDLETLPINNPFFGDDGAGSTVSMALDTATVHGGSRSERFTVTTLNATGWGYGGFGTMYPNCVTGLNVTGASTVSFWLMTDQPLTIQAELHNTNANKWKTTPATSVPANPGVWQQVSIPVSGAPALVLSNVDYFGLVFGAGITSATVYLDDISFN